MKYTGWFAGLGIAAVILGIIFAIVGFVFSALILGLFVALTLHFAASFLVSLHTSVSWLH